MHTAQTHPTWWCTWTLAGVLLLAVAFLGPKRGQAQSCAGLDGAVPGGALTQPGEDTTWTVAQANRLVRSTFQAGTRRRFAEAASAYLRLITAPLDRLTPRERAIVRCHHRQLALILPDSLQPPVEAAATEPARPIRGLRTWWRAQDPLPATPENERLITHLQRVAHAVDAYRDDEAAHGVDPRGEVYIRLGPPARTTTVRFNASRVITLVRTSTTLTRSDFPANEYWVYPHVDEHAKYIFVKQGGRWQIGTALDLVPRFFQIGLSASDRGRQRAQGLGTLLEEIYSQLGTVDVDYGPWYQAAFDATAVSLSGSMTSRMRQVITQGREYEAQRAFDRTQSVPRTAASVADDTDDLPVDVRIARFLETDGTTRTEIYWAPKPGALRLDDRDERFPSYEAWEDDLLLFAAVPHDRAFERRAIHYERYMLQATDEGRATIGPQTYAVTGDTGRYHLRLQWQQHIARRSADSVAVGPRIKVQAARFDSLTALNPAPGTLTMSDLKPLRPTAGEAREPATPYPFGFWNLQEPLLLHFEVYHLARNENDQTQYTVAYEVERQARQGGLRGWMGGTEAARTTAATTYTGTTRTAQERILLQFDDTDLASADGTVRITVRVTDETTGQQVERTITFDLAAGPAES